MICFSLIGILQISSNSKEDKYLFPSGLWHLKAIEKYDAKSYRQYGFVYYKNHKVNINDTLISFLSNMEKLSYTIYLDKINAENNCANYFFVNNSKDSIPVLVQVKKSNELTIICSYSLLLDEPENCKRELLYKYSLFK